VSGYARNVCAAQVGKISAKEGGSCIVEVEVCNEVPICA